MKKVKSTQTKPPKTKNMISLRKTCRVGGTGLSHFILMDTRG